MSIRLWNPKPLFWSSTKVLVTSHIANFPLQWHHFFLSFYDFFLRFSTFLVFWSYPTVDQPTVDNGGVRRGGSVAVAVIVCDKWHVTCDIWHMTHDKWHVTHDTWFFYFFYEIAKKKTTKCVKVPKSVKKRGYYSIGGTIRIVREIKCLPYAGFFDNIRVVFEHTETLVLFLNFHTL